MGAILSAAAVGIGMTPVVVPGVPGAVGTEVGGMGVLVGTVMGTVPEM